MAELIGGAVLGTVVNILFDEVIDALKELKAKDANLRNLQNLLQRVQPIVKEISTSMQDGEFQHPARPWLSQLREQLEIARDVVQSSTDDNMGIFRKLRVSRESVKVCETISKLLHEASAAQWASNLSSTWTVPTIVGDLAEDISQIKVALEKERQLLSEMAKAVTSRPSSFRKEKITNTFAEQLATIPSFRKTYDGFSASPGPAQERKWKREGDPSKPVINFGGDAVAQALITNLVDGKLRKKWVGLWAMGGAGKTFTARDVYNDPKVQQHFTGGRFWVTVSKDQLPIRVLVKQLFKQLSSSEKCPEKLGDAINKVKTMLNDRERVLLVLDDVWQDDILKSFDMILKAEQNVILVTTRDQEIFRCVAHSTEIIEIPRLSVEQSWQLFSWHAFRKCGTDVPSDVEDLARDVAQECKGLPLALEVIGTTMADAQSLPYDILVGRSLTGEWRKVLDQLRSATESYKDQNEVLYEKLQLSVDNLSSVRHLQDCFLYFAAFPEDYKINRQELVNMWVAEGLVGNEDSLDSREEEAQLLFGLLVAKSMIELTDDGNRCKIHDVMRDVAQRNLKWNFRTKEKIPAPERRCLYAPGLNSAEFPPEWTTSGSRLSTERLSFRNNELQELPHHFNAPSLRVLILAENYSLRSLHPGFFRTLSRLKVLDLSRTAIKKVPADVIRSLPSLVFLDVSNCSELQMITHRIEDLQNLETLVMDSCNSLQDLPRLKNLTKLHTFSVRNDARSDGAASLGWVYRASWKYGILQVFKLPSLRRLRIASATITELPNISPLVGLEELEIEGLTSFPVGMMELQHLKSLLVWTYRGTFIPALDNLPLLEELLIEIAEEACPLPKSFGRAGAFPSLRTMTIEGMDDSFTFGPECMPRIETLQMTFRRTPAGVMQEVPTSVTILRSLKFLLIGGHLKNCQNLEVIFGEPACFPNLEYLELMDVSTLPANIARLPKLRWLKCDIPKRRWPENVLRLAREGKLDVESSTYRTELSPRY